MATSLRPLIHKWILLIVLGVVAAAIYFPVNQDSGGLIWLPLEWPKLLLSHQNFNWEKWWLQRQVFEAYHNYPRLVILDVAAIFICIVTVFGTRLIGWALSPKIIKSLPWQWWVFMIPGSLIFVVLGLYTLQTVGSFNVFNFFVVVAVLLSLTSGLVLEQLWERRAVWGKVVVIAVILATWPRNVLQAKTIAHRYQNSVTDLTVTPTQLEMTEWLRTQTAPDAIVQNYYGDNSDLLTPYIAYFSHRQSWLSGQRLLETHNQPVAAKQAELDKMFKANEVGDVAAEFKTHDIDYLILSKTEGGKWPEKFHTPDAARVFTTVFENQGYVILQPK